jgi:phage-related minor tail protein
VIGSDLRTDAAEVLRRCQMPEDEIRWVLTAEDPAVVHMILELHRERLEEELAERRKALRKLEAWLTDQEYERCHGRTR